MKALRVFFVILGISCIILNIALVAFSDTEPLPVDAGLGQMLAIYVSKMFLLITGIVVLALSSGLRSSAAKTKSMA